MSWTSDDIDTARMLSKRSFDGILSVDTPEQLLFSRKTPDINGLIVGEEPGRGNQRPMQPGRCYDYDGTDDQVYVSNALISTNSFTISLWMRTTSLSASKGIHGMGNPYNASGTGVAAYVAATGYVYTIICAGGTSSQLGKSGVTINTWYHLVSVIDRTNNTMSTYLNNDTPTSMSIATLGAGTINNGNFYIGRYSASSYYFPGRIFDFQIIPRAITQAEVGQLYTLGCNALPKEPRTLWLKSDEQHPLCATDSSGNRNHGVLTNVTATVGNFFYEGNDVPHSYQNDNSIEQVFKCDTTNYLTIANGSSMVSTIGSFSFCWRQTVEATGSYFYVVGKGTAFFEILNYINYYIRVQVRGSSALDLLFTVGYGFPFNGPTSYAVVVSYSGGTAYITLYKNGVQLGSTQSGAWAAPTGGSDDITIGSRTGSLNHSGALWDCQLYNVALTSTDVLNVHNGTTASGLISHLPLTKDEYLIDKISGLYAKPTGVPNWVPVSRNESNKDYAVDGGKLGLIGRCPRNADLTNANCLTLDGTDDYAPIPASVALGFDDEVTITARIKTTKTNVFILHSYKQTSPYNGFGFGIAIGSSGSKLSIWTAGSRKYSNVNSSILSGNWVTVAVSMKSGGVSNFYVDGVFIGSVTTGVLAPNYADVSNIGSYASSGYYFQGSMSDLRIYNRVLSNDEHYYIATANMSGRDPTSANLIANYPLSEGAGSKCYDVGPNGLHATITNANLITAWATKQDVFHYNTSKGFTKYTHATLDPVYVPYSTYGIPLTITPETGYSSYSENPSGAYDNMSESKIDLTQGVASPGSSELVSDWEPFPSNYLSYPDDLSNAYWTKTNITPTYNFANNPVTGSPTVAKLMATVTNAGHSFEKSTYSGLTVSEKYVHSIEIKPNGYNYILLYTNYPSTGAFFNLSTKTFYSTYSGAIGAAWVDDLGNGWMRCNLMQIATGTSSKFTVFMSTDGSTTSFIGDITKGILVGKSSVTKYVGRTDMLLSRSSYLSGVLMRSDRILRYKSTLLNKLLTAAQTFTQTKVL